MGLRERHCPRRGYEVAKQNTHTLLVAVGDVEVGFSTVCGAGTSVVLNGAAALNGGILVQEGGAVDGERPVRGIVLADWRSGATETSREGLHVAGCHDGAESSECSKSECVLHCDRKG